MKDPNLKIDWTEFIRFFNETMRRHHSIIPELIWLTRGKKAQVQRLVNELGTMDVLNKAVENMARSDVCNGRIRTKNHPQGLKGSFTWLTSSDETLVAVANGDYNSIPPADLTPDERRQLEAERYRQQQEVRRAENRAIEEQIREEEHQRRERQQKEWERNKPSQADLKRILGDNWLLG